MAVSLRKGGYWRHYRWSIYIFYRLRHFLQVTKYIYDYQVDIYAEMLYCCRKRFYIINIVALLLLSSSSLSSFVLGLFYFFFNLARQPPAGQGLLIHDTPHSRTPLDEWSTRRRDLYLTTHNTHNRHTSMSLVWFEPTVSTGERQQTYALGYGYIRARTDTTQQTNICMGIHRRHVWLHLIRHACPDLQLHKGFLFSVCLL